MTVKIHQRTRVHPGLNSVKIRNDFPRKHINVKNLPRGSKIHVDSSFVKPESLKGRMSKIKASSQFKAGESKAKVQLQAMKLRKGKQVNIRRNNLKVNIS